MTAKITITCGASWDRLHYFYPSYRIPGHFGSLSFECLDLQKNISMNVTKARFLVWFRNRVSLGLGFSNTGLGVSYSTIFATPNICNPSGMLWNKGDWSGKQLWLHSDRYCHRFGAISSRFRGLSTDKTDLDWSSHEIRTRRRWQITNMENKWTDAYLSGSKIPCTVCTNPRISHLLLFFGAAIFNHARNETARARNEFRRESAEEFPKTRQVPSRGRSRRDSSRLTKKEKENPRFYTLRPSTVVFHARPANECGSQPMIGLKPDST